MVLGILFVILLGQRYGGVYIAQKLSMKEGNILFFIIYLFILVRRFLAALRAQEGRDLVKFT